MEMPSASRNEREFTAMVKAIVAAITPDTDAIAFIIADKLAGFESANRPAVRASAIEENIKESVSTAVKAALADIVCRLIMDVTALREQTIANIELLHDLTTDLSDSVPPDRTYSAPKLVTDVDGNKRFSAFVVRIELEPDEAATPDVSIEVRDCESNIDALQRLYEFSQEVLFHARNLLYDNLNQARFDFWDDLEGIEWGAGRSMGGQLGFELGYL